MSEQARTCAERVWHKDGSYHLCGRRAKFLFEAVDAEEERPLCGIHERALRRWVGHGWLMFPLDASEHIGRTAEPKP